MKRAVVLLGFLSLLGLAACMSVVGGWGGMSPSQFKFQPMVPHCAPGPGGWKSAGVVITLVHMVDIDAHRKVVCPMEVQVPEVHYRGVVTDAFAQMVAAKAADIAADRVLHEGGVSAVMCNRFREEMQQVMGESIPGTRVIKLLL